MNAIELMVNRIRANNQLSNSPIYVLTSKNREDNAIQYLCAENSISCIRGDENDVLSRYAHLAKTISTENIIRLTSDCPFICPEEILRIVRIHQQQNPDYTTNTFEGSKTPDGFDVEIFKSRSILLSDELAVLPSEREHVTFNFLNSNIFSTIKSELEVSNENIRLTLDTAEDYILISKILDNISDPIHATHKCILKVYEKDTSLKLINSHLEKNHGWASSLKKDSEFIITNS